MTQPPKTRTFDPAFDSACDAPQDKDPFEPARAQKTISLMARAIGYLSRREHSTAELTRKLAPFAQDAQEIAALLEKLAAKGLLSDARYAAGVVHRRGAKFGAARVAQELKAQGVQGAALEQAKETLKDSELARCKEVWQRKFGERAASREDAAKQARFLAQRGFASSVVMKVVKGCESD